jgi:hypothetical protein
MLPVAMWWVGSASTAVEPSLLIGSGKAEEIQMVKSFMQQP